jgi:hypothetical protein
MFDASLESSDYRAEWTKRGSNDGGVSQSTDYRSTFSMLTLLRSFM